MRRIVLMSICLLFLASCTAASPAVPAAKPTVTLPPTAVPTAAQPKAAQPEAATSPTAKPQPTPTPQVGTGVDAFAFEQNRRLGRGVNLGNALEAPREGEWGVTLQEEYFKVIKDGGFNSIRVPIRWNAHANAKAPYTIDPAFFDRVDWVIKNAEQQDLTVILDFHNYLEMMESPGANKQRFVGIWEQIAEHYRGAPDSVYFELLNEPNGSLGTTNSWNQILDEAIKVIRKTNPRRTIVVGPGNWNSIPSLFDLKLPEEDRNLIVTFHYYQPFQFTHQGADWAAGSDAWMGTTWMGKTVEKESITMDLNLAKAWSNKHRRPIFMGEFGAYSKADMDSRARWTEFMARSAEEHGFSWAYWEFCSGFGVYDSALKQWVEPLHNALIPDNGTVNE
jgi:endoglucanase